MVARTWRMVSSMSSTTADRLSATARPAWARRQALERQPDGEQTLDHPVVQVAGHAVPLLVDGHLTGPLVEPGVLHGDAGRQGQGLDDGLVVRR